MIEIIDNIVWGIIGATALVSVVVFNLVMIGAIV